VAGHEERSRSNGRKRRILPVPAHVWECRLTQGKPNREDAKAPCKLTPDQVERMKPSVNQL
jgi:hypothetical protein